MMLFRTGRKLGRTLYLQTGPEPSDDDRLVGMVDTPALAALIVGAVSRASPDADLDLDPITGRALDLEAGRHGSWCSRMRPGYAGVSR